MELVLYHGQGILYSTVGCLLIIRIILNYIIYVRIDSVVTQSNTSIWTTFSSLSEQEKENLKKNRPDIIDINKDEGSLGRTELFHITLTFWWPTQVWDDKTTSKLKLVSNILNILFLVLLFGTMFFFLYMQDINAKYHHVTRDWTRIF